ncbi:MAG: hypothetical protein ACLU8D_13680, partial [Enterocloster sp.]
AETGMELFKEDPQYGATGYPIVVQSQYQDGFLQPYQEEIVSKMPGLTFLGNTGLYEYNGQVIYLMFSKQQKVALVTHNHKNSDGTFSTYTLYCDPQGRIREYTEESRAAIDAEIAEHLAQLEAEIQTQYGVSLSHRKAFSVDERHKFARTVKEILDSYPAGSIRIIADATQTATGKPLKFQSIYIDSEGNKNVEWWIDGLYGSDSNIVQTSGLMTTTAHELGHAMESTLSKASGGKLRQDFAAMNGGHTYDLNYFYNGASLDTLEEGVPPCFKSGYHATSFSEDFAETFSDAMAFSTAELQDEVNSGNMAAEYFQKVVYVKQLFNSMPDRPYSSSLPGPAAFPMSSGPAMLRMSAGTGGVPAAGRDWQHPSGPPDHPDPCQPWKTPMTDPSAVYEKERSCCPISMFIRSWRSSGPLPLPAPAPWWP